MIVMKRYGLSFLFLFAFPVLAFAEPPAATLSQAAQIWKRQGISFEEKLAQLRALAEAGDVDACRQLGDALTLELASPEDLREGLRWYAQAARQGDAQSQLRAGSLCWRMDFLPDNLAVGFAWVQKAAQSGLPEAAPAMADALYYGWGAPRDVQGSFVWDARRPKPAYQDVDNAACTRTALAYLGGDGVEKNLDKAAAAFLQAQVGAESPFYFVPPQGEYAPYFDAESNAADTLAASGDTQARYHAACASHGSEHRIAALRPVAEAGHVMAQYNLGLLLVGSLTDCEKSREGVRWLRRAAEQGYPPAYYQLGYCQLFHIGAQTPPSEALDTLRTSAYAGIWQGMLALGYLYAHGSVGDFKDVAPVDLAQSRKWFAAAARYGSAMGALRSVEYSLCGIGGAPSAAEARRYANIAATRPEQKSGFVRPKGLGDFYEGWCFFNAVGAPRDDAKAFAAFARGARAGAPEAFLWLSRCYAEGRGVEKSPEKSAAVIRELARLKNTPHHSFGDPDIRLP